jgi:16S rRNA (uracil1498-N3)-methyltransferase
VLRWDGRRRLYNVAMARFFIPPDQIVGDRFTLTGSEARHAAVVLRKKVGDAIGLFDGKDLSFQGQIESVSASEIQGKIISQAPAKEPSRVQLTLGQALIKGSKWDWLVEKASEIGVARLVPLVTARTIVKPERDEARERWKRIALAAAKQCGRSDVMEIDPPKAFADIFGDMPPGGLCLIPSEKETLKTIKQALRIFDLPPPCPIFLLIGPEGGWESSEVELAVRHGAFAVRLGSTLLRSETAGLVAATLVLREFGDY